MSSSSEGHLHFVQSLETLQGGGLGVSARQLHQTMGAFSNSSLISTVARKTIDSENDVFQAMRVGPDALYFSPELRRESSRLVSEAEFIHGHGLYVYPNFVFGREARKQGKSLIYHIHGFFDPWIVNRSKLKKKAVELLFERKNLNSVSFMRALTKKEESQIRGLGFNCPVEVIPNGIDLDEADAALGQEAVGVHFERKKPKRLLFLSRLHPKKGLDLLISVWAKLATSFEDWELLIVGPDEGGYQAELEKMIVQQGVEGSCRILPAVSGATKHLLFQSSDLFVLPSYSEGFPMAVLEALANRVACVVTTECNVPEFAECGAVWECLPKGESLKEQLSLAMEAGDEERLERAAIGRALLEKSYTWDQVARRLDSACHSHC